MGEKLISSMTMIEKEECEDLFRMRDGSVLDFSNNSFARFVGESVNIDIYHGSRYDEEPPKSKAKKLRQIWNTESDSIVGKLLCDLLDYYDIYFGHTYSSKDIGEKYPSEQISSLRGMVAKLMGHTDKVSLPPSNDDTLKALLDCIEDSLAKRHPENALNRLHTFSMKYLRTLCENNGISVKDNSGKNLPLNSLAGELRKKYEQYPIFKSTFATTAIRNSISLFAAFNDVRNNYSYAHVNDVLVYDEAEYVVKIMAATLCLLDSAESNRIWKETEKECQPSDVDIPF